MDIVITYVDGNDPVWRSDYEKYTNKPLLEKRFRDWGTLKYLMRGIEKNMPFIKNVYLVVSGETQVPAWVNRDKLHIVLHKDIIPEKHLPVFNSCAIEMFLHKINGLDEKYLYFNDDIFPVLPCAESDFFENGKGKIGLSKHLFAPNLFKRQTRYSYKLACRALGKKPSCLFLRPQHICTPMLKSECAAVSEALGEDIAKSLSGVRQDGNINQYLFLDYMYMKGMIVNRKLSRKHLSMALASPQAIAAEIMNPSRQLLCINDVQMNDGKFEAVYKAMNDAFEQIFPDKSKFEL